MQQLWRPAPRVGDARTATGALQLNAGRLRLRPARLADLHVPARSSRTAAGCRDSASHDALAARVRRRHRSRSATSPTRAGPATFDAALDALVEDRRPAAAACRAVAGADRRARRGVAAGRRSGTTRSPTASRRENLFLDQSKDRRRAEIERAARAGRRVHARARASTASRTRCAATWTMSCERGRLRGRDHAGADDAAEGAVPECAARAGRAPEGRGVSAVASGPAKAGHYRNTDRRTKIGRRSASVFR